MKWRATVALAVAGLVLLAAGVGWPSLRADLHRARVKLSRLAGEPSPQVQSLAIGGEILITVDTEADVHPISPYIYGVAKRDPLAVQGLGATLNRWGGNPSSRFNWTIGHAWNAGSDWEFRDTNYGGTGSVSDSFVAGNRAGDMASLIAIPALGWVARDDRDSTHSVGVPENGGPALDASGRIAGYDPAANRARTSVPSLPRKPGPFVLDPDPASPVVYQDEWVNHLKARFGAADAGGVAFYAFDNEPMLWCCDTHADVHPAEVGYDELASRFIAYADAVKAVDPSAQFVGPESWGWQDLYYSALDRGTDNFATHADQRAHGGMPLMPWFLQTVRNHDQSTGQRSLDVVGVHFYPQAKGVYGDRSDPATDALRLRSTRALWDPSYVDESWIAQPVDLIPTLRSWIAKYYPGTKIGITEYNFGGGKSPSAGLVQGEVLGIFGREDVYLADYWTAPAPGTPTWAAFQMYRNYDGQGGHFGSTSVAATSSAADTVSAYAATEPGWVDLMLINKNLGSPETLGLDLRGARIAGAAQRYEWTGGGQIQRAPDLRPGDAMTLPPASLTLLRVPVSG